MGTFSEEVDDELWKSDKQYRAFKDLIARVQQEQGSELRLPYALKKSIAEYESQCTCQSGRVPRAVAGMEFTKQLAARWSQLKIPKSYKRDLEAITKIEVRFL